MSDSNNGGLPAYVQEAQSKVILEMLAKQKGQRESLADALKRLPKVEEEAK